MFLLIPFCDRLNPRLVGAGYARFIRNETKVKLILKRSAENRSNRNNIRKLWIFFIETSG
jgi:hypothetical protein